MKSVKNIVFILIVASTIHYAKAQDTLTFLQYNLLNYGNNTGYCNSNNNNLSDKDNYIKTIVHYVNPDIFTVNEMSESPAMHQRLLDNTLNTGWTNYYKKANFIKIANSSLVNMLYYNSKKLRFYSHVIAQSYIRDIDIYTLYYFSNDLAQGDTTFINCIVAHLKAGQGTENSNKRKIMAKNLMNYIANHTGKTNYILMGDFNVYSNQEPAINQFVYNTNINIRFNDPINRMGPWHNNANYKDIHTQSTHTISNGCASTGGMDDRFDYILISNDIKNKTHHLSYIQNSYHAVGQDGNHFNKAINASPTNTSVPADILNALYNNSDHLPVTMKLKVDKTLGINEWKNSNFENITFNNPAVNKLTLTIDALKNNLLNMQIISLTGKTIINRQFNVLKGINTFSLSVSKLTKGMYILRFIDEQNKTVVKKLIKQ